MRLINEIYPPLPFPFPLLLYFDIFVVFLVKQCCVWDDYESMSCGAWSRSEKVILLLLLFCLYYICFNILSNAYFQNEKRSSRCCVKITESFLCIICYVQVWPVMFFFIDWNCYVVYGDAIQKMSTQFLHTIKFDNVWEVSEIDWQTIEWSCTRLRGTHSPS